jgi:hypothetical protein
MTILLTTAVLIHIVNAQAVFDTAVVDRVAAANGVSSDRLIQHLSSHQSAVSEGPGADTLVYEWRKYHPGNPLVARTDQWYVCTVRLSIWAQFESALDQDLTPVRAVHDSQAQSILSDTQPLNQHAAMLLYRD